MNKGVKSDTIAMEAIDLEDINMDSFKLNGIDYIRKLGGCHRRETCERCQNEGGHGPYLYQRDKTGKLKYIRKEEADRILQTRIMRDATLTTIRDHADQTESAYIQLKREAERRAEEAARAAAEAVRERYAAKLIELHSQYTALRKAQKGEELTETDENRLEELGYQNILPISPEVRRSK